MSLRSLLGRLLALLLPLSTAATIYLYLYPVFNGCAFPLPGSQPSAEHATALGKLHQHPLTNTALQHLHISDPTSEPAIFRLLVLADPQLEGDTSLPFPEFELVPRIRKHWSAINQAITDVSSTPGLPLLHADVLSNITTGLWTLLNEDIPRSLSATQKRIDLLGNDFYLAHIYRTLFWWTKPTHTTVLGDLLGSQWIPDEEFASRSDRYWNRVFAGGLRVDDNITWTGARPEEKADSHLEPLGPDGDPLWARRIINIAGNHDIGYAGDVSEARMSRFERQYGRANWDIRFKHPPVNGNVPTLHVINLNTLVFDTPALSEDIQGHSYAYLNDVISHRLYPVEDKSTFTLLLTHLPLHKEEGVCTDGPYFTFHDADDSDGPDGVPRFLAGGLREQNHLSDYLSDSGILQGIFGLSGDENVPGGGYGRKGLILTGHDHTGCDTVHYVERTESKEESSQEEESRGWKWAAKRYEDASNVQETPSIREVTLRSMMGEFGGNAGLLSAWFDADSGEWDYAMTLCPAGVQHIWWAVHVAILVTAIVGVLYFVAGQIGTESKNGSARSNVVGGKTDKGQSTGNKTKGRAKPDRKK